MKKLFGIILMIAMLASMAAVAFAEPVKKDYDIVVHGFIGLNAPDDSVITIEVTDSDYVKWVVDQTTSGAVVTPTTYNQGKYTVENKASNIKFDVALQSFAKKNSDATTVQPQLTLKLTDDLALPSDPDISDGYTGAPYSYPEPLEAEETWEFAFTGVWTGGLNVTYEPTYDMVLRFTIHDPSANTPVVPDDSGDGGTP
jgi:hypothetical protein